MTMKTKRIASLLLSAALLLFSQGDVCEGASLLYKRTVPLLSQMM